MVTSNAAILAGQPDVLGTLRPGAVADVSARADERGRFVFRDNGGGEAVGDRLLRPLFCLRQGERIDADAPLLPQMAA